MPSGFIDRLCRQALVRDGGGLTDGQLLGCFIERRDEAAFAALVRRHGPMVLGVCQRVLGHHHDAEDAFQATFLVLARKAASLRARELVGNWLYGAAYRTALEARARIGRRRAKEKQVEDMPQPRVEPEAVWPELRPLLDQELDRLPEKYRTPVVLCDLEGRTRREVARQLKLPEGTLSSRLATARKLLARRLARYGLAVSGGALAAALSEKTASACVSSTLAASTARGAVLAAAGQALTAGAVPARVVALAEGVVKTMLWTKLRALVAVALIVVVGAGVVGLAYRTTAAEPNQAAGASGGGQALADDLEALRLEVEGLRKGLQATRKRVDALETEVQGLKAAPRAQGTFGGGFGGGIGGSGFPGGQFGGGSFTTTPMSPGGFGNAPHSPPKPAAGDDPLTEAEDALKKLRADPKDKQAADALEGALKRLKERAKPEGAPANPQKK